MTGPDRSWRLAKIDAVTRFGGNLYLGRSFAALSRHVAERAWAWGWHPNRLTLTSLALTLAGALLVATGATANLRLAAVLIYLSYVFDWADGQLARASGQVSPFGGWLDQLSDRLKEFALVLALGWAAYLRGGGAAALLLAYVALFVLYLLEYYDQMARAIPRPVAQAQTGGAAYAARGRLLGGIDFAIDEQWGFYTAGLLLAQPLAMLVFVDVVALLFLIYKPIKGWRRYFAALREGL